VEKWSGGFGNAGASGVGRLNFLLQGLGLVIGTAACYLFGTVWLAYQAGMDFMAALSVGVVPFVVGDVVKIVVGVAVGNVVRKRLVKAGVV
jgi:biotin transport system substrate-specific component